MFHSIKGKNVKFEKNKTTAVWVPSDTGGHLFTEQPLEPDQDLRMKLDGTGGIELGIINEDPEQILEPFSVYRTVNQMYQFLNDVKIHKRSCTMVVKINYEKQEVTSTYGSGVYTQKLKTDKKYWLVADVKYGEVEIKIQNRDLAPTIYSFSNCMGNNITVLNDPTIAQSLVKSPASLCMYQSPIKPGQILELKNTPKAHQGTIPGRYYVRLFLTDVKPEKLQQLHPDRFDVSNNKTDNPKWTTIETFEKEDCFGTILLEFDNRSLKYTSANGKRTSQDLKNLRYDNTDLWLVLELYGVTVKMKDVSTLPVSCAGNVNLDEPDACPVPPRHHSRHTSFISAASDDHSTLTPIREQDEYIHPVHNTTNNSGNLIATTSSCNLEPAMNSSCTLEPAANSSSNWQPAINASSNQQPAINISSNWQPAMSTSSNTQPAASGGSSQNNKVHLEKGIRKHFTDLLRSLMPTHLVDLLYQYEYITYEEMVAIQGSGNDQARKVLLLLIKRPIKQMLLEQVLKETEQLFLLGMFLNEEEKE